MINIELVLLYKNKTVNVQTVSGSIHNGTVVDCSHSVLTLSTRWSAKHQIVLDQIVTFWADEDKPEVE